MAYCNTSFENVILSTLDENGQSCKKYESVVRLQLKSSSSALSISILNGTKLLIEIPLTAQSEIAKVGKNSALLATGDTNYLVRLSSENDLRIFHETLRQCLNPGGDSIFGQRTDPSSAEQYFQFYSYLSQQQNMMQDYIRTSTYQRAMLNNVADFQDKVVLDVGAGSGILSFFAIQAGAKKVYAIEASSMAQHCEMLVHHNKLTGKIEVLAGKVEEIELPEQVDIIISEPMGYMLFNERMLETFLHAKKWLKPGGLMFPTQGDLHIAPFTDDSLYMEQFSKANFWYQPSFHGVDLQSLREAAVQEYFKQPVVDTFDVRICMAKAAKYTVDFSQAHETELHDIDIPLAFLVTQSGTVHGLAFWFDVAFRGSQQTVWLSTAPTQPLTHWYQVRCLLQQPIFVRQGQTLQGRVHLRCNKRQSYDVDIELTVPGTSNKSSNTLDLKNPFFRYTGQQPVQPPGTNNVSPSDAIWGQSVMDSQTAQYAPYNMSLMNGSQDGHSAQLGAAQHNLMPLGKVPAKSMGALQLDENNQITLDPKAATSGQNSPGISQTIQTRTSIGGGISPALFNQGATNVGGQLSISNQFMIGDYAVPGNVVMPSQGLSSNIKS